MKDPFLPGPRVLTPTHTRKAPHAPSTLGTIMRRHTGTLTEDGNVVALRETSTRDATGRYMVQLDDEQKNIVFAHESELTQIG